MQVAVVGDLGSRLLLCFLCLRLDPELQYKGCSDFDWLGVVIRSIQSTFALRPFDAGFEFVNLES